MNNLKNKKILLCVTGSIAAFKACEFIRLLKKQNCHVQVVMSESSQNFIGKLTLASLSDNEVLTDDSQTGLEHVKFAIEFDAVVILPATANILCKAGAGIADDIISTVLSICEQPKLFVPAMNFRMWQSRSTQKAVQILRNNNINVMNPDEGALASLHKGEGRLPRLYEVMNELRTLLDISIPLKNKKILVTAGPTRESIDPIRFISNKSSGKMGFAISEQAKNMGAEVYLISGPVSIDSPPEVNTQYVETTDQMYESIQKKLDVDVIFMSAAISDYTPKNKTDKKIKSKSKNMNIAMEPTIDIIKTISKKTNAIIVGFALETCDGEKHAIQKMNDKDIDFIVLNHPTNDGCGIDSNFNKVTIYSKSGDKIKLSKDRKDRIAQDIIKFVLLN